MGRLPLSFRLAVRFVAMTKQPRIEKQAKTVTPRIWINPTQIVMPTCIGNATGRL